MEGRLGDEDVEFYRSGNKDLQTRWTKYVVLEGYYVEK